MVDFPCHRFQSKVTSEINQFNEKNASSGVFLLQETTSDTLQTIPEETAVKEVQPFLKLVRDNLSVHYIKYSEEMYGISPSADGWEQKKVEEMIVTPGLFYVTIMLDKNTKIGFLSFLLTEESVTGEAAKRLLYLMEIQLEKNHSRLGVGKLVMEKFVMELCRKLKMDLEFVCFKDNTVGNKFYKQLGLTHLKEPEYPQLMEWFTFLNIYRNETS